MTCWTESQKIEEGVVDFATYEEVMLSILEYHIDGFILQDHFLESHDILM